MSNQTGKKQKALNAEIGPEIALSSLVRIPALDQFSLLPSIERLFSQLPRLIVSFSSQ